MGRELILVVEDEMEVAEVVEHSLSQAGFAVEVESRGDRALERIRRRLPSLVVLDLLLPGLDGLELARILKRDERASRVPILMLTGKSKEADRIAGLEVGADDYLAKPFSPRELVLRVRAILRRLQSARAIDTSYEAGDLRLDVAGHRLLMADQEVRLTATEFRLIKVLLGRRGRVQTRARLLAEVWGYAEDVDSRTVDTHIRRLRRKLGDEASRIETVVGVGYRLRE
jgi:two-component system phosphate regulon response regulator PhoB